MNTEVLTPLLDWLDLAGVAIFALTGALVAAKERQTFVTLAFFALVTGVGGGTVRDLLIGAPVFWIHDGGVAGVCLAVALFAWFIPTRWWAGRFLSIADGLGLAAYAVLGSAKALQYGVPPVPAALMGVITGCVGGIIRDVVATSAPQNAFGAAAGYVSVYSLEIILLLATLVTMARLIHHRSHALA